MKQTRCIAALFACMRQSCCCVVVWLPFCCLLVADWLPFSCRSVAVWLLFSCLLVAVGLPFSCCLVLCCRFQLLRGSCLDAVWLSRDYFGGWPFCCLVVVLRLSAVEFLFGCCLMASGLLFAHCIPPSDTRNLNTATILNPAADL